MMITTPPDTLRGILTLPKAVEVVGAALAVVMVDLQDHVFLCEPKSTAKHNP